MRGPDGFRWGLNCWLALVPMRVENGALRVVSDTHRQGVVKWRDSAVNTGTREVSENPQRWVDAVMEPGDICIFDRNTVHGSGPNGSDQPRVAYAVQFHRHDTEAFFDERWELLTKRPRYDAAPRPRLTNEAQRTE
ncbi:MAG: phytanoyl-CoA dioxygenase family protein [Nostochopsis sp.]